MIRQQFTQFISFVVHGTGLYPCSRTLVRWLFRKQIHCLPRLTARVSLLGHNVVCCRPKIPVKPSIKITMEKGESVTMMRAMRPGNIGEVRTIDL